MIQNHAIYSTLAGALCYGICQCAQARQPGLCALYGFTKVALLGEMSTLYPRKDRLWLLAYISSTVAASSFLFIASQATSSPLTFINALSIGPLLEYSSTILGLVALIFYSIIRAIMGQNSLYNT